MNVVLEIRGVRKSEIEPHSGSLNCGFGCNGKLEDISKGRFPSNTILSHDEELTDNRYRFFYCAKASKKDRDEGLENFELQVDCDRNTECYSADVPFNRSKLPKRNTHPTVKPTELMQYLIRLVTPKGGTVLDPFMGSGSTGKAVAYENKERNADYKFIGIEKEKEYCEIAKARIKFAQEQP